VLVTPGGRKAERVTRTISQSSDDEPCTRRSLARAIALAEDAELDWAIVVNYARAELDRHLEVLLEAVRERARATALLTDLLELQTDVDGVADALGSEIQRRYAAVLLSVAASR
jgi:hypothetical protein